jgi:hypothetical protein
MCILTVFYECFKNAFSQMQLKIMVMICMNGFASKNASIHFSRTKGSISHLDDHLHLLLLNGCISNQKKIILHKDCLQLSNPPKIIPQKDNIRKTIFSRTCWKGNEMGKTLLKINIKLEFSSLYIWYDVQ